MISVIIIAIFFIGCAFFSGAEIGLISLDKYKLKRDSLKNRKSKRLYDFITDPDKILGTTLIGTNISIVIVSSVFTAYVVNKLKILNETSASLLLAGVLLIVSEIIPKMYFKRTADKSIPKLFFIIRFFALLFTPFIWLFAKLYSGFSKIIKISPKAEKKLFSKDDLSYLVREAQRSGDVNADEQGLIEEVLTSQDLKAKNIMIPRTNIFAVQKEAILKDVIELSRNEGFTRIPVFDENIDHIIGLIVIHDLLNIKNVQEKIEKYIRKAYFIPEVMKVTNLLKKLQEEKTPIAIVVDEYGGTAGLVSVEDIIEELVGEIEDEYDVVGKDIYKIKQDTYLINAEIEIEQIIDEINIDIPEGDYETLAGFLISKFERIPNKDDEIKIKNYKFSIKQVTSKKIEKVLLTIKNASK
ncbi:MAG: hemolysin family protein [Candidatus Cloacimonadota bacterium]|nr:hemolysin family protein [Candidatus Cloacimonadota bacterium]